MEWRQGFVGGMAVRWIAHWATVDVCGSVEETVAHLVTDTECAVLEGMREQFGSTREESLVEILLFRETERGQRTIMDFSFYDQPFILDIFAQQTAHQSLCGDFFNLSTVPSISAAFQTNAIYMKFFVHPVNKVVTRLVPIHYT